MQVEVKDKETWETTEETVREMHEYIKKEEQSYRHVGCFSWIRKKRERQREKEKQRKNNIFPINLKIC